MESSVRFRPSPPTSFVEELERTEGNSREKAASFSGFFSKSTVRPQSRTGPLHPNPTARYAFWFRLGHAQKVQAAMKQNYRLFRRDWGTYYVENIQTGKQDSLGTKDKAEAQRLFHAKNETAHLPAFNLKMARIYLQAADPKAITRTWQYVMDEIISTKQGDTIRRWTVEMKRKVYDHIRNVLLVETQAEHFLRVLSDHKVSTNVYLRRLHNVALDMNWLGCPIIPKRKWPKVEYQEKRAITLQEHEQIIGREFNPERRHFYELLWHIGASQSDLAHLHAEDVDWEDRTITYSRMKTGSLAQLHFRERVARILAELPGKGPLFPYLTLKANWWSSPPS